MGIGFDSWRIEQMRPNCNLKMNGYVADILKSNRKKSELCADLVWYFYECPRLMSTIRAIQQQGYRLTSNLVNYATITGRILTYAANLQGLEKCLRSSIVIPDDMDLACVDFRSCEPGVVAGLTGHEFRAAIESGDVYSEVGGLVKIIYPAADTDQRNLGKRILVPILNGATAHAVGSELGCDHATAQRVLEKITQRFASSFAELNRLAVDCSKDNVIRIERTGMRMAQVVPPPDIRIISPAKRDRRIRSVIVQGSATLMFKKALLRLPPLIDEYGLQLLFPIHDSFLFLVPRDRQKEACLAVKEMMDQAAFEFNGFSSPNISAKIELDWHRPRPIR